MKLRDPSMHDLEDGTDYEASTHAHTPWRRVLALSGPHVNALLFVLGLIVVAGFTGAATPS